VTVAAFLVSVAKDLESTDGVIDLASYARRCRDYAMIALNEEEAAKTRHARFCADSKRRALSVPRAVRRRRGASSEAAT
jgi:hypothetical protein